MRLKEGQRPGGIKFALKPESSWNPVVFLGVVYHFPDLLPWTLDGDMEFDSTNMTDIYFLILLLFVQICLNEFICIVFPAFSDQS
jgi:hypothetical protein